MLRTYRNLALGVTAAMAVVAGAQTQDFKPIPDELSAKYKLNYAKNFFASPEDEKRERASFMKVLDELQSYKGKAADSSDNLLKALRLNDQALREFVRHYIYLYMRYATNTKDDVSRGEFSQLGAEYDTKSKFLQQEMLKIDDAKWTQFLKEKPELADYTYFVQSARRLRPHTLSLPEEELLGRVRPLVTDWQPQLYQFARDRTEWGKVKDGSKELSVLTDFGTLINSKDRKVREEAYRKEYSGHEAQRDLYAFTMVRLVNGTNQLAKIQNYADAPTAVYFGMYLDTKDVKSLYDRIGASAELNKRYQKAKADYIGKHSKLDDVKLWDLSLLPPDVERPRFAIGKASDTIIEALKPLGSEYEKELRHLFDPENGRLDLVKSDNRVPGAFSWGFPGGQMSFFYSFAYEGFYDDVATLAHEAGHAVDTQLMANSKVLPANTNGPNYFTEASAMFNELLLADYLYKKETNPKLKTFYLEQFMNQAMAVFGITKQASIEQAMYDGVAADKLKTPDDFDKMALEIGKKFSIWYDKHPDLLKNDWISVHHYFDQPLYYQNYVYANILSLKYFELFQKDPSGFVGKYLAMTRNGFNAPPTELLKKFLAIDLNDPNFVSSTVGILESRLAELENLYKRA